MNKNPFSLYDFLGYLFPGLITTLLIIYVPQLIQNNFENLDIKPLSKDNLEWINLTGIVVIISYIIGHIIAYLSSLTVEYFTNRTFGYPSRYLLKDDVGDSTLLWFKYYNVYETRCSRNCSSVWQVIKFILKNLRQFVCSLIHIFKGNFWIYYKNKFLRWFHSQRFIISFIRIIVAILLFPITASFCILKRNSDITKFIARPLEPYIRQNIITKLHNLTEKLNLSVLDVNSKEDYHRIVMHYVYLNVENCERKIDNYVAIYGFLRAITLIACLLFDIILFQPLIDNIISEGYYLTFSIRKTLILISLYIFCIVSYMAFVKFYRRFTLENYMTLLTEKEF